VREKERATLEQLLSLRSHEGLLMAAAPYLMIWFSAVHDSQFMSFIFSGNQRQRYFWRFFP